MSNQDAYTWLSSLKGFGVMWGRKDENTIYVWTGGYKTFWPEGHYGVEEVLRKAGMRMMSEDFDRHCGKTIAYYKHKERVK